MRFKHKPDSQLLHAPEELRTLKLIDFLMWGYSDLSEDVVKGVFAEWLVAHILGIPSKCRFLAGNSDILHATCPRIEVKSSAYWQSWKLWNEDGTPRDRSKYPIRGDSEITFGGLQAKDVIKPGESIEATYKSEIYVFCFQREKDPDNWNAMDLDQWEFYLLPVSRLKELKCKSISLKKLKTLRAGPLDASGLAIQFQSLMKAQSLIPIRESSEILSLD
jgi:hypothetical protein